MQRSWRSSITCLGTLDRVEARTQHVVRSPCHLRRTTAILAYTRVVVLRRPQFSLGPSECGAPLRDALIRGTASVCQCPRIDVPGTRQRMTHVSADRRCSNGSTRNTCLAGRKQGCPRMSRDASQSATFFAAYGPVCPATLTPRHRRL